MTEPMLHGQLPPPVLHLYREAVERLIREAASPAARWVKRTETGTGIAVDAQGRQTEEQRQLDKSLFPPCLIREVWDRPRDTELVADYIRWQAPLLLQLT
jgi:hypothetical protein